MRIILFYCLVLILGAYSFGIFIKAYKPKTLEFTDENCIRAIVGEYAVDDLRGMTYIAHAIRNRGTLKGVYGFHAKHIDQESKNIWLLANWAWFESTQGPDPLQGANEWRSLEDIAKHGMPKLRLTKIYNGMYFFINPALKRKIGGIK